MNLKVDVDYTPFKKSKFYGPGLSEKVEFQSNTPLFYLVKRGLEDDCFDKALRRKFIKEGGKIKFNTSPNLKEIDIVATGPKKAKVVASGYTFNTSHEDISCAVIDSNLAPAGYAYLLIKEGYGTMATVLFDEFGSQSQYLQKTKEAFKEEFSIELKNKKRFNGYGDFSLNKNIEKNGKLYVGEAAGFQDYFLGFGMYFALQSGYLAAESVDKNLDYNELYKKELRESLKVGLSNRFIFESLGHKFYNSLIKAVRAYKNEPLKLMKSVYRYDWKRKLVYPFALFSKRHRKF